MRSTRTVLVGKRDSRSVVVGSLAGWFHRVLERGVSFSLVLELSGWVGRSLVCERARDNGLDRTRPVCGRKARVVTASGLCNRV